MNVSCTVLVSNSYTSRIMASVYIELVASSLSRTKLFKKFKKSKCSKVMSLKISSVASIWKLKEKKEENLIYERTL